MPDEATEFPDDHVTPGEIGDDGDPFHDDIREAIKLIVSVAEIDAIKYSLLPGAVMQAVRSAAEFAEVHFGLARGGLVALVDDGADDTA